MTRTPVTQRRDRLRRAARGLAGAIAAAALLPVALMGGAAHAQEDDGLAQVLDPDQAQGTGQVVRDAGHVDFGPTLNTGEWRIQIHDDTDVPRLWRNLEDVVLQVNDASISQVPDSEEFAFLGLDPGSDVWIVPQVQEPDVIWAGWNTQEPTVLENLDLGVTLSMLGVEGPGELTVFLQSGNFGDTEPLWSTLDAFPQDTWIEVNTHTHANWVFSEPGIYLVEVQIDGELASGEMVSARDTLRFSVGDATDPQEAFGAEIDEALVADAAPEDTLPDGPATESEGDGGLSLLIWIVVGAVGVGLVIAILVVIVSTRRAKSRARAARAAQETER
ncbi:choice-of-anchor M domain-containing protein [Leucobacter sp. CSA1]|uniref:Choice-of-anchor M domain-containing protein n=1 Tax=Leucobacter chromiisoli TaxID=2796471 RepID=A0A934UVD7_9MICO|nr:choice-of-anchor M domain-containing protein [Leucobacter chromiisoli]MBK0419118.1 choice-of-anchor M domain-containing protein [Leucobacter chromiisoli]